MLVVLCHVGLYVMLTFKIVMSLEYSCNLRSVSDSRSLAFLSFMCVLDLTLWEQVQEIVSRVKGSFHEFDIPSRDISFTGQPFKENVTLLPCTTCLVSLTDRPVRPRFTALPLSV